MGNSIKKNSDVIINDLRRLKNLKTSFLRRYLNYKINCSLRRYSPNYLSKTCCRVRTLDKHKH